MLPIYETVSDAQARTVIVVMGSQMSKTEFCLNLIGESADTKGQPVLFVMPNQALAEDMSKDRFHKMVRLCPSLSEKLAKGRMNQVNVKWIGGNRIGFAWASSASQLCSYPAGLVILDERDRMPNDVDGEGDPVILADARTSTYPNAKIVVTSTPTILGASAIWKLFLQGNQNRWHVQCNQCYVMFLPCIENFGYEVKEGKVIQAYLQCPSCKAHITDKERDEVFAHGKYIASNPQANIASFWVSGLCSPWRTFSQLAIKLYEAKQAGDPRQMQTCVNTSFGECFAIKGESLSVESFENLKQPYLRGQVPNGVEVVSCGVDVQQDCMYYAIRGWGKNDLSWLLDYGLIYGNTDQDETWQKLDILLRAPIGKTQIKRMCIDAGYRSHFVYAFCRSSGGIAIPCKGNPTQTTPIRLSAIDITREGTRFKPGGKLHHIDDGYFKSLLISRILNKQWFLPSKVEDEYLRQIAAEEQIISKDGKILWKEKYRENHFLDAEKLNLVAATLLRVDLLDQTQDFQRVRSGGINLWR